MKLIIAIGLLCILIAEVRSFETGLALNLEDVVKIEDVATIVDKDRAKDNEISKLGGKASEKLAKSKDLEDKFSLRKLNEQETAYKFNDYADDAAKNDLAKSSNFAIQLKDESNIAKANEVRSKKGTDLEKATKSKVHKGLDSEAFDKKNIGSEHDSERIKSREKKYGVESLFSKGFGSLFDKGTNFEFGSFYRAHPKRIEPVILHPADNIIVHPGEDIRVHPGDKIQVHPGDDIIIRSDDDVIVSHSDVIPVDVPTAGDVVDDVIPVDVPTAGAVSADALERVEAAANIGIPQGLLGGRLAHVFKFGRLKSLNRY